MADIMFEWAVLLVIDHATTVLLNHVVYDRPLACLVSDRSALLTACTLDSSLNTPWY